MPLEARKWPSSLPLRFVYLLQLTINHCVKLSGVESMNGVSGRERCGDFQARDLLRECGSVNRVSISRASADGRGQDHSSN